jgi:hypothetical protein
MTRNRKIIYAVIGGLGLFIFLAFLVLIILVSPFFSSTFAENFLHDAISGKEEAALTYLSSSLIAAVKSDCPDQAVTKCISALIPESWGQLEEIYFVIGSGSRNTQLYYVWWSNLNQPIVVVVMLGEENGREVIIGWRGFVPAADENADSLLLENGRHDNEFPKP